MNISTMKTTIPFSELGAHVDQHVLLAIAEGEPVMLADILEDVADQVRSFRFGLSVHEFPDVFGVLQGNFQSEYFSLNLLRGGIIDDYVAMVSKEGMVAGGFAGLLGQLKSRAQRDVRVMGSSWHEYTREGKKMLMQKSEELKPSYSLLMKL